MNILLAGSLKCREHIVAVETYNRNSVKGPHTHMCQGLLHIRQTLDCTTAGSARASNKHASFVLQETIRKGLHTANSVNERFEAFGHAASL